MNEKKRLFLVVVFLGSILLAADVFSAFLRANPATATPGPSCPLQNPTQFSSNPCGMIKNTSFTTASHTQGFAESTASFVMNPRNKDLLMVGAFADFGIPANDTSVGVVDSFGTVFVEQKAFSYNYSASTHILTLAIWTGYVSNVNAVSSITPFSDTITITWIGVGATTRMVASSFSNVLDIGNKANATTGLGSSTIENTNMTLSVNNAVEASIGGWNPNVACGTETALPGSTFLGATCNAFEPFNADMGYRGPLNPLGQTIQHGFTLSVSAQWAMLSIELIPTLEDIHTQPFISGHTATAVTKNSGIQNRYQVYFTSQCCSGPPAVPNDRLLCLATFTIKGNDTITDRTIAVSLNDTTNGQAATITQYTLIAHSPLPLYIISLSGTVLITTAFDTIVISINFLSNTNLQITMIGGLSGPRISCVDINV